MIILYVVIGICLLILLYMHLETRFLKKSIINYYTGSKDFKIAQLSDIHIKYLFVNWKKIRQILSYEMPDVIILTGDYVDNNKEVTKFLNFLDYINDSIPIILCFGNHDYNFCKKDKKNFELFKAELKVRGIVILENESYKMTTKLKSYNFIGIEDAKTRKPNAQAVIRANRDINSVNIVITHNPEVLLGIEQDEVNYLFCGHFHGGQIWMPFNFEYRFLRKEKIIMMGFKKGRYSYKNIQVYINSGIGNVMFPLRFFSTPEISIFNI